MAETDFKSDIEATTKIFKKSWICSSYFFISVWGIFTLHERLYCKNFKIAFGQHSGIIDINKDRFGAQFPINEKYGELKRFKSLINYNPLEYKFSTRRKKLDNKNNPQN